MADLLFAIAQAAADAGRLKDFAAPLALPRASVSKARALRAERMATTKMLVLHAEGRGDKGWPIERFGAVLRQFLQTHPEFSLGVVGITPAPLEAFVPRGRILAEANLPLSEAFALVASADLFLGIDSCMLHVADLCRVPGIAIFGPTRWERWGFRFGRGIAIQAESSTREIDVGTVVAALEQLAAAPHQHEVWCCEGTAADPPASRPRTINPDLVIWSRMAEPQDDGYDTTVALNLAHDEHGWRKPATAAPPAFFDGRVALRRWPSDTVPNPVLVPGAPDHPNLKAAEDTIRTLWPTAARQFEAIVSAVYPMAISGAEDGRSIGSCSGQNTNLPLTMYVTCFDTFGTAESLLHEMAHIKLRCLGIEIESSSRLVLNDPAELYVSPLRSFKRPMTALMHAFYSWLHLTELDLRLAASDPARAMLRLPRNLQWIEQMLREIRENVRLDAAGHELVSGMYTWADRILARGRSLVERP